MSSFYQKINTLYFRDEKTNKIQPEKGYVRPEFELLKDLKWEATEKVDGTNISIVITKTKESFLITFRGKTENANIPAHLVKKLMEISNNFKPALPAILDRMEVGEDIELFGEGYGYKIQSGGAYLGTEVGFILFDIRVGKYWLNRESCESVASDLKLDIVPIIGQFTIPEAEEIVKKGFTSKVAKNDTSLMAEGLVLRAPLGLKDRSGERLIVKIKTCDWNKYLKK